MDFAKEQKLLKPYLEKWAKEGERAGKSDTWMADRDVVEEDVRKVIEENNLTMKDYLKGKEDYIDKVILSFVEGWRETEHYRILYRSRINEDAQEVAEQVLSEDDTMFMEYVIDYTMDMEDAFWFEGFLSSFPIYSIAEELFKELLS